MESRTSQQSLTDPRRILKHYDGLCVNKHDIFDEKGKILENSIYQNGHKQKQKV